MTAAIELSDWFGGEAKRVYGLFVETAVDREQRELVDWIRRGRVGGTWSRLPPIRNAFSDWVTLRPFLLNGGIHGIAYDDRLALSQRVRAARPMLRNPETLATVPTILVALRPWFT